MTYHLDIDGCLNDEIRAFLHIAGIELREDRAIIRRGTIDWVLHLHRGNPRSLDYWKQVARRAYHDLSLK